MSLYDRDREHEIRTRLSAAQEPIVALARLLQRAAFVDHPEESAYREIMANPERFRPAPIYMRQAAAINSYPAVREIMLESLEAMRRRHAT